MGISEHNNPSRMGSLDMSSNTDKGIWNQSPENDAVKIVLNVTDSS